MNYTQYNGPSFTCALAQFNPVVGAITTNIDLIRTARTCTVVDLLICSELIVSGYPPEDLVYRVSFLEMIQAAVQDLASETSDGRGAILLGAPWLDGTNRYNAALLLANGCIAATSYKHHLPSYGVFDEARVFTAGPLPMPIFFNGIQLGVMICEDMWYSDVTDHLVKNGAEILIVLNGSPFEEVKLNLRYQQAKARVIEVRRPLIYVNQTGGQDELVFDGRSFIISVEGRLLAQAPSWDEILLLTTWSYTIRSGWDCFTIPIPPAVTSEENIYQAMVVGLRDYVTKNNFPGVILGISGGIDSALSATIAVDALGADKVWGIIMPSSYTSDESLESASILSYLLGIRLDKILIDPVVSIYKDVLIPLLGQHHSNHNITEENIQARARGVILMALSNKFKYILLSTSNKSEVSVGYTTLYGDICGGYAILKDIYKTTVVTIARWRNEHLPTGSFGPSGLVIPEQVIIRPPSAELKFNQTDQDILPPYPILDTVLTLLIEEEQSVNHLVARGFDASIAKWIWQMLNFAEYKRRQAPPGLKITRCAFGRDRRYPIINAF